MNKLLIHMMNAGDIDHRILPGLQKMQKAGQVRRFTMPAIKKDFINNSSNDNLANPIAIRKKMQDDFIAKQNIAKRNAAQAAQDRQGYIRQAEPPRSAASKAWAILTNPMTALAYKAQGRDIPDNFERGPKNSLDIAANIVNPFFYINEGKEFLKGVGNLGYKAVTDPFSLSGMDFLNTAMHGVGAIPLVAEGVQGANLLSQGLRGASKAYKGTAGMTSKMGRIKNAANAGAIELGYTPGDITGHSYFNIPADEVSKMMSKEMGSLPKGAYTFDGNMSKNSAPLFWTQAARSPKGFTVVNPGTSQGLNWSGTMGKRVSNALPKNIENIMPNAANYAEELKNRVDYLKKMGDPQSLQKAAALERDGISSQIVSDFPNAAMTDYNVKNSFGEFLNNYKTTLDNPIIEVNRKTGLNFPMTKVLDENIGKWTNDFYEQPSIYMVKGNPLSRVPKLIGDYAKKRTNAFFVDNPRTDFIRANTLYNAGKNLTNQGDYKMGGSYDEYGQPCYECGGMYAEGGYYDCPDQEKDPVTGKCKAEVVRGREANAANKAAGKEMNAWAKQVAAMDKELAKQYAAQDAGQLTFDYDWMQTPLDKADKKAAIAGYKQFFQQNPNVFVADDTSGYSPEQKYIIASKLKQRMSTPMGSKLAQQQFGVDPRFYDLQRMQSEMAPKMGGWNGMRNWLFNVYKQEGGPIVDPRGQWAHPGKVTRIPSSNITMQGVPYPVLGVASSGQQVMMQPGQNYNFGDAEYVDEYPMMQGGGQSSMDSVRHQAGKILKYEQLRGGPGGAPLPQYANPKYMDMLMGKVYPEARKIMPNGSAMEIGEAMDFIFNAGFDQSSNKITKDPRAFALQEYYRQNDPSKLDADGKWAGRKNAPYSFDQEYNNTIGKLPENQRRILMNKGRDWYYKNINNPAPGVPNSNYNDTWYGRIWNTNDYQPFNPNNPNFTPKKEMGGGLLSKSVSCSNCGWSWKAVDGGSDPMTCHKCGGTIKMQDGGQRDYSSILQQNVIDAGKYPSAYHKDYVTGYPVANTAGSIPRPGGFDCPPGYTKYSNGDGTFSCIMTNPHPGSSKVDFSRMTKVADDMQFNKPATQPLATIQTRKNGGEASLWDIIKMAQGGEMIRRADGSYSRRGLWDNIRANKGSGKKPTKQMLEQERKIKSKNK